MTGSTVEAVSASAARGVSVGEMKAYGGRVARVPGGRQFAATSP
jgi:hypothetical protein